VIPLETPATGSGKQASDEQFPVASRLLPAATRSTVMRFYRFARAADDIADAVDLTPGVKLELLAGADAALRGAPPATAPTHPVIDAAGALRDDLSARGVPIDHARHLLQAFVKDATVGRYATWSDLLAYCNYSAAPVGRFLLDLHGEPRSLRSAADALCNAHQILNHLQDAGADRSRLDRVYLPLRLLSEAGTGIDALDAARMSPALRLVFDRMLDGVDDLVAASKPLIRGLRTRGLRMQAAVTHAMARRLARKLRQRDALRRRVALSGVEKLLCAASGVLAVRGEPG